MTNIFDTFHKTMGTIFFWVKFCHWAFFQNNNIISNIIFKKEKSITYIFQKKLPRKKYFKKIHVSTHYFKHKAKI
jgi:hypothetical protein